MRTLNSRPVQTRAEARLGAQFDAIIHFDEARAVEPLETNSDVGNGRMGDISIGSVSVLPITNTTDIP
jgi:hypothetical protein